MNTPLNPATLPSNDTINPYAFCVDLNGQWFMQKGKMIAYYGNITFDALMAQSIAGFVAQRFSSPLYARDWVVANGEGKLMLGDRGFDLNSFDLEHGNLTVRAANLLAFEASLQLKQSIVPGFLTLIGTGKFLASSNGPVMFVEPPIRVDPQALVGWADCPAPSHHYDTGWMTGFLQAAMGRFGGVQSGEERQFDFTGTGTVLMQSTELVMDDPMLLRQVDGLGTPQLQSLAARIQARLSSSQA